MLITVALYAFSLMNKDIDGFPITWRLILMGMGLAFTISPLSNGVMGSFCRQIKSIVGSGIFNLFKNIGRSVGVAVMGAALDQRQIFHRDVLRDYISVTATVGRRLYIPLWRLYWLRAKRYDSTDASPREKFHLIAYKAAGLYNL